jgi:hypothetical protein
MNLSVATIAFKLEEPVFLKDPTLSDLGRKILTEGARLMRDCGYEDFTFKKLASSIGSTEASVYRYFENKHKLLLFYFIYFWYEKEHRMAFAAANIPEPADRLRAAINVLTDAAGQTSVSLIDPQILNDLVTREFPKVYLTKSVDEENKSGVFQVYKRVVQNIVNVTTEISPDYPWTKPLISTVMEAIFFQQYYAEHLPSLTYPWRDKKEFGQFFCDMILKTIKSENA